MMLLFLMNIEGKSTITITGNLYSTPEQYNNIDHLAGVFKKVFSVKLYTKL